MARLVQAIGRYGPRIELRERQRFDVLAYWLRAHSILRPSHAQLALLELRDALLYYLGLGHPLELPGIGTFTPAIGRDGRLRVTYRPDRDLTHDLNKRGQFKGTIRNRANIGIDAEAYKALWDHEFPEDPLTLD